MYNKLKQTGSNGPTEEATDRRSIDDLSGEETQHAIDYLNLLDRETTTEHIEWAASQLEADEIDLATPMETLNERGEQDKRLVAPHVVKDHPTFHIRDDKVAQILTVTEFPRRVSLGWLIPLTLADVDHRISMHVQPRDSKSVRRQLQKRYTQTVTALAAKQRRGKTNAHAEELAIEDLERLLRNTSKGTTKFFDVSIYIELIADSHHELDSMRDRIDAILAEQNVELEAISYQQLDATGSVAPLCTDTIANSHPIQLEALGTFFNLVEPPIYDPSGVLFGFDDTKRPVVLDRYALSGHSMAISGKVGSGKTYFRKLELYRRLLADPNVRCILFDPAGDDYPQFAEALGGEVIRFGGEHTVNPMAISPPSEAELDHNDDTYALTIRSVLEMVRTHFDQRDGMETGEEGILQQAAHYAYLSNGIIYNDYESYARESPTLDDLFRGVDIIAAGGLAAAAEAGIVDEAELETFRSLGVLTADESTSTSTATEEHATATSTEDQSSGPERQAGGPRLPVSEALVTPPAHQIDLAENLRPKFASFKPGGINYNLNGQTNLDLSSRVVVIDISSFTDTGEMPLILHAMLSWSYLEAKRSPFKVDVTFDEAHYLLGRAVTRDLINLFIRHARHYDAGLTLMSQTAHEFVRTPERREVYDNCDIKCLFYTQSVSEETKEYFEFSEDEVRVIQSAIRGQNSAYSECLLASTDHGRRRLEIRAGPFEHHVLDEDLDPWAWLAEAEGIDREAARDPDVELAPGSHPSDDELELSELPAVMGQDKDLELSMKMGRDLRVGGGDSDSASTENVGGGESPLDASESPLADDHGSTSTRGVNR